MSFGNFRNNSRQHAARVDRLQFNYQLLEDRLNLASSRHFETLHSLLINSAECH